VCGNTINNSTQTRLFWKKKIRVASNKVKMRENYLHLFGHIQRRLKDVSTRKIERYRYDGLDRCKCKFKNRWIKVIRIDLFLLDLNENMILDRNNDKKNIYVDNYILFCINFYSRL
jgi:hypothetical protein